MKWIKFFWDNGKAALRAVFRHKMPFFLLSCFVSAGAGSLLFLKSHDSLKTIHLLQEGMNVCFRRVGQGMTAIMMGPKKSHYLDKAFSGATQDCFGEVMAQAEGWSKGKGLPQEKVGQNLNFLSTEVYWFYQEIAKNRVVQQKEFRTRIRDRYTKLEMLREEIADQLDILNKIFNFNLLLHLALMFAGMIGMALAAGAVIYRASLLRRKNDVWEKEASRQLQGKNSFVPLNIENLIKGALNKNHLPRCAELLSRYHEDLLDNKLLIFPSRSLEGKRPHDPAPERRTLAAPGNCYPVHLGNAISKVVGIHAEKFFTHGIILELDIEENIYVKARSDSLQQVFRGLMNHSIGSFSEKGKSRKIIIKSKVLGGTVMVQVMDTGKGLDPKLLLGKNPFENDYVGEMGDDLSICKGFMEEFEGRMTFSNHIDKDNKVLGTKINLMFKRVIPLRPTWTTGEGVKEVSSF